MKIFIMTDMEGVAGVYDLENYCQDAGKYYQYSRQLLTGEVNAAIRGFFDGGATGVHVQIGHHTDSIDLALLDERATLTSGHHAPIWPWGLEQGFSALAFVGQHAKAGTSYSHLAHTGNMRTLDQRVNGLSIGEYGALALCAMELGIPTIFAAGEEALCREAEALTPGVVTAAGKRGIVADDGYSRSLNFQEYRKCNSSACHEPIAKVRRNLETGAKSAMEKLLSNPGIFRYPKLAPPYYMVREFRPAPENTGQPESFAKAGYADSIIDGFNQIIYNESLPAIAIDEVVM